MSKIIKKQDKQELEELQEAINKAKQIKAKKFDEELKNLLLKYNVVLRVDGKIVAHFK